MFHRLICTVFMACTLALPAQSEGERAGDFDYYLLALSWSPTWCKLSGDARGSQQCARGADFGFVLHGLWPQYENGWPSYCRTSQRPPSRSLTSAQADIMGTSGAAWHQWKKHGSCTGLSGPAYYQLARKAYERINRPEVFRKITKTMTLPPSIIEEAFLEANPDLYADQITITCKDQRIQEARICMDKDLNFRRCGRDTIRDCKMKKALMAPIR
ncbi:ribonuclease T(2) [Amylibacter marinus]|uniref:Ribonuclease T(2) n=1 Tax=Amylibacter marinus TaxID=1475483 RepID=A0ABQ5VXT5_9RHOB|nr:ribonuclease T2 [Amylibacter marinus]GLQ35891.1 ribonuclease T(2) [Amylibacter marinus]